MKEYGSYRLVYVYGAVPIVLTLFIPTYNAVAERLDVMGKPFVEWAADTARSTTPALAYQVLPDPPGGLCKVAVRYDDVLERTPAGWRIVARRVAASA